MEVRDIGIVTYLNRGGIPHSFFFFSFYCVCCNIFFLGVVPRGLIGLKWNVGAEIGIGAMLSQLELHKMGVIDNAFVRPLFAQPPTPRRVASTEKGSDYRTEKI
jgi:hypothetical protein